MFKSLKKRNKGIHEKIQKHPQHSTIKSSAEGKVSHTTMHVIKNENVIF